MANAAAIDRVMHHSGIMEFDVPSYRTDAAQQRGQCRGERPLAPTGGKTNRQQFGGNSWRGSTGSDYQSFGGPPWFQGYSNHLSFWFSLWLAPNRLHR